MDSDTSEENRKAAEVAVYKAVCGCCAKLMFKKDGGLTWLGWVALALATAFAGAVCSMFEGCVNAYTRCPFTESRIESVYQCTKEAAAFSYVVMFPQVMNTAGSPGFMPENLVTVPIGLLGFVDVAAEACLDTVFYPADAYMSRTRKAIRRAFENR